MKCYIGDIVNFKIGSIEIDKGEVKFIEEDYNESTLYINSYSGWAYKVLEKNIVSLEKLKSNVGTNKLMTLTRRYKCPTCKNAITITNADFIKGVAMTSCGDCGRNAFTIEEVILN